MHSEVPGETSEPISTLEKIKERISELSLGEGTSVDLKEGTVDAQRTENDAVFLIVTGSFHHPKYPPRPFLQTFVLAIQATPAQPQSTSAASYYVRNSVFRILSSGVPSIVSEKPTELAASVEAVEQQQREQHERVAASAAAVVEDDDDDEVPQPVEEVHVSAPATWQQHEAVPDKREVEEETSHAAPATFSYADMARGKGSKPAAAPAAHTIEHTPAVHKQPIKAAPEREEREKKEPHSAVSAATRISHAIYVNNVEPNAKQADLEVYFAAFGPVVHVDLPAGRGFAFVEFSSVEAVHAVLAKQAEEPLALGGTNLRIEERQLKPRSAPVSSRLRPTGAGPGKPKILGERKERDPKDKPEYKSDRAPRPLGDKKLTGTKPKAPFEEKLPPK